MRRRSVTKSVEHVAKIIFYPTLLKTHYFKNFFKSFGSMITNTASTYLKSVQNNVVLGCKNITDTLFIKQIIHVLRNRGREGIVSKCPSTPIGLFEEWKIYNPAESKEIRVIFIFSQVRPVRIIFFHCLFIAHSRKRRFLNLFIGI